MCPTSKFLHMAPSRPSTIYLWSTYQQPSGIYYPTGYKVPTLPDPLPPPPLQSISSHKILHIRHTH